MRRIPLTLLLAATVLLFGCPWIGQVQATEGPNPQNIILLVGDDLDWSDLPFFNSSIHWKTPQDPPNGATTPEIEEAAVRVPDLNRSAARLLAVDGTGNTAGFGLDPRDGAGRRVVPVDVNTSHGCSANGQCDSYFAEGGTLCTNTSEDPRKKCTNDLARKDLLRYHGGLKRIATNGVVMPRMYTTSARCAPSRAALFSGRHQNRVGVPDNGAQLKGRELTIAEYLKQGCKEGNSHACYRTALFGKWHLGSTGTKSSSSPWSQGFDEYVGFGGGSRIYSSGGSLKCSPVQAPLTTDEKQSMESSVHPPTSRFCQLVPAGPLAQGEQLAPVCTSDATCESIDPRLACGTTVNSSVPGRCFLKDLGVLDRCTPPSSPSGTDPCGAITFGAVTYKRTCQEHWRYVGRKDWDGCPSWEANGNLECCSRSEAEADDDDPDLGDTAGNKDGSRRGRYPFKNRMVRTTDGVLREVAFLFDGNNKPWPCNDDRSMLLEDRIRNFTGTDALTRFDVDKDGTDDDVATCLYSERFLRDMARNFIVRQLPRGVANDAAASGEAERFFMTVTFHAGHVAHVAPMRTKSHYIQTKENGQAELPPKTPDTDYWAIIEELDAAVGAIMRTLEGVCDQNSAPEKVGATCGSGGEVTSCGGTGSCVSLSNNTLVLFTNDNGSPTAGYGVPLLRGAKQDLTEGGIRAGLLAYGPSVGACKAGTCAGDTRAATTQQREVTALGSMVDLYPTIADAAGFDDLFATETGAPDVKVCMFGGVESPMSIPCSGDQDCRLETNPGSAGWEVQGTCGDARGLDGRSLLRVLSDPAATVPPASPPRSDSPEREQVFAAYPTSGAPGMTVITKPGRYADECDTIVVDGVVSAAERSACGLPTHVCAYERAALAPGGDPPPPGTPTSGRTIMGASCKTCLPTTAGTDCNTAICEILGGVCFNNNEGNLADSCVAGSGGLNDDQCGLEWRARCQNQNDCQANAFCVHGVRIPCKSAYQGTGDATCVKAGWKGKGNQTEPSANLAAAHGKVADIFDVRSNPEEMEGEALNCEIGTESVSYYDAATVDLDLQLGCWRQCLDLATTGDADARRCDRIYGPGCL